MRRYRYGAHTKTDLKVHLVWVPKYRKRVLAGEVAIRVRDLIRQIAMEHELTVLSGKVARDHVHVFVSYRPNQDVSTIVQWLKGISSRVLLQEFPHLRKAFWGKHFWARGYLAARRARSRMKWSRSTSMPRKGNRCTTMVNFQLTPLEATALQAVVVHLVSTPLTLKSTPECILVVREGSQAHS